MAYIWLVSAKPCRTVVPGAGRWAARRDSAAWSTQTFPKWLGTLTPQDLAVYWGSPDLQSCTRSSNRFSSLQPRQWDMASKRVARAQSLHWCVSKDCKLKQTLRGIWSVRRLRLGDSPPVSFSWAQGTPDHAKDCRVEGIFTPLGHVWKRTVSHARKLQSSTGESSLGRAAGGKVWHSERIQKVQSEPFPSVQTAVLPGWEGHVHRGTQGPPHLAASWEPGRGHQGAEGTYLCAPAPRGRGWRREGWDQTGLSDVAFQAHCSDREFFSVMGSCEQPCSTHLYHYRNNGWHISPAIVWVANTL